MPGPLDPFLILFAAKAPAESGGSLLGALLPFIPIIFLFYFMILRPQQQQERKRRQKVDALKKNDRVLTSSGIFGTVVSVDHEGGRVILRVDDDKGVRIEFSKGAVADVLGEPEKVTAGAGK